jgi:hypothetical protein
MAPDYGTAAGPIGNGSVLRGGSVLIPACEDGGEGVKGVLP